jgi:glutathione S-transferase
MTYLADKYEKETLYPKDLEKRTIVNQRLYFDAFFYQKFVDYYIPQVYLKKPEDAEKIAPIKLNMQFLNTFLEGQEWVCGENMTLADLALIATVSTLVESAGMDIGGYPNVVKWYKKCQETIPGYEANTAGCEDYKKLFKGLPKIS